MQIEPIAHIHTDFPTKFGVPRQSGLASELTSTIIFAPAYRNPDCLRGIADFSHLWLIWEFDKVAGAGWSPTVLPPKLGGKTRVGVFATRSPFRPNPLGLSCVQLLRTELHTKDGPVLYVAGADLVDGTPIYDIKPYLPYADSHPDAVDGADPGEQTRRPPSGARLRPHPRLPARPDAPLRLQLLRPRRPLPHPGPHPHRGGDRPVIKGSPPRGVGVPILA